MLLTIEFFFGLAIVFFVGYLLAILMEKIFHIKLDNFDNHE
jgi:uncharacterized membrane protein